MMVQCPHCKLDGITQFEYDRAERNVENYGAESFVFQCQSCKNKFAVGMARRVCVTHVKPVPQNVDCSW